MPKMYEFSVNLDDKYVRVVAENRLLATKQGAIALGVVWRERARDMIVIQGREIRRKELEKVSPSPSALWAATSPRGRGKGAAAPRQDKESASRNKSAVPTYKTGPLAGLPMRTTQKGRR